MNFKLYIGLTTQQGDKISKDYVLSLVSNYFTNFTVYETIGYYCGQKEKSLIIEVFNTKYRILQIIELAYYLNQESIGVFDLNTNRFDLFYSKDYVPPKDDEEYLTEHWLFNK